MTRSRHRTGARAAAPRLLVLLAALAGACGDRAPETAVAQHQPRDGWARAADSGATGGGYLAVVNRDTVPVTLQHLATADAEAAGLHETMVHDGVAHMRPQAAMTLAPGDSLVMAPGGLHLMLVGVRRTLAAGDTVRLVLQVTRPAGTDGVVRPDSLVALLPVRAP